MEHKVPNFGAEVASAGAILAHFFGLLPMLATVVATALAICWYAINIWESETVRGWFGKAPK